MNKTTISSIKENVLAILVAFVLAISLVFLISKVDFLKADITGYKKNSIPSNVDFLIFKSSTGFKIISNKNFKGVQSVVVDLVYDATKVKIDDDDIVPDNVSLSFIDTGSIELQLNGPLSLEKGKEILSIKGASGNYINLNSIQVIFTDGTVEDAFNIGNISR